MVQRTLVAMPAAIAVVSLVVGCAGPTASSANAADPLGTLDQYAFVILPALLVAEQFGIPLPAVPALLGFGALAAHGRGNIPLMLSTLAAVALIVDFAWYELGRRRGALVLRSLCRLSREPDVCVRRAETSFARYGARGMLVAKFVPGLTTVLPPLAGAFGVGRVRFAAYELAGVLLWAGTWIGVGYVFSDAVAVIAACVATLGLWLAVVAALLGAYVVGKYLRRQLYLRRLPMATIPPKALNGGASTPALAAQATRRAPGHDAEREERPLEQSRHWACRQPDGSWQEIVNTAEGTVVYGPGEAQRGGSKCADQDAEPSRWGRSRSCCTRAARR